MGEYQFGHEWEQERARLASLEAFEDPETIRRLEALGVGEGWRCLEIGAGGGSIAAWLCEHVGPTGHVLATELDTRQLETLDRPNLEVRRHDITSDELPDGAFDLIHTRAVLIHLPGRRQVLERLVTALAPGGWLLCEETDFCTFEHGAVYEAVREVAGVMIRFLEATGADVNYGRRLYGDLRSVGLADVDAEGRVYTMRGAHPSSTLLRLTFERLRPGMVAAGLVADERVTEAVALLEEPDNVVMSHLLLAGWGRRADE